MLAQERVAAVVMKAIRVLGTVELDDETLITARKVREIGADWKLPGEFIAAKLASFQFRPKNGFRLIVALAQRACSCRRASFSSTPHLRDAVPHSVVASRRHLSPLRRERKGARIGELAPFLSPVERGRGGTRSVTEWGSTFH